MALVTTERQPTSVSGERGNDANVPSEICIHFSDSINDGARGARAEWTSNAGVAATFLQAAVTSQGRKSSQTVEEGATSSTR